jgi:hypothetical protein
VAGCRALRMPRAGSCSHAARYPPSSPCRTRSPRLYTRRVCHARNRVSASPLPARWQSGKRW